MWLSQSKLATRLSGWRLRRSNGLWGLLLCGLVLAGCQFGASESRPDSPVSKAPASATTPVPPGQLAYIGLDGNIYVTAADGQEPIAITDDATAPPEITGFSYHRISWSPTGQLAFASVTRSVNQASSAIYVTDSPGKPVRQVARNNNNFVIYMYWSPVACRNQPTCRQLAYLIQQENNDIGLYLVDTEAGKIDKQLIGLGRPFYFSWEPNGERIIWHTGGARRHNPAAELAVYDLQSATTRVLPEDAGLFMAPAWSPRGDHWLGVSARGRIDQLQRFGLQASRLLAEADDNHITFAWSPQGHQVAYAIRSSYDTLVYGPIHLFDLNTGQTNQLTSPSFRIAGFFWSPDGQKIAYLQQPAAEENWLQWRMYELAEARDRGFNIFTPSLQLSYTLGSFNQYAQSHRFWSPDSRYLVYADRDEFLVERVWLVDTWAEKGAPPILVDKGTFAVWSWQ